MRLYFLRHADAHPGMDDAARALSPKGREQARRLGSFLKQVGVAFDAAYASPLVRAVQTAELVLELGTGVRADDLQRVEALLNTTGPLEFQGWLRCLPEADHILLVGHNPSISEHVRRLLSLEDPTALDMSKGCLAVIRCDDGQSGVLKLYLAPKFLGG